MARTLLLSKKVIAEFGPRIDTILRDTPARIDILPFSQDMGASDAQIESIVHWVDDGAPMGNEADMPPAKKFPDPNRWQLAEKLGAQPDLIIRSTPYTLAAHTQDKWFRPTVETGVTEPR